MGLTITMKAISVTTLGALIMILIENQFPSLPEGTSSGQSNVRITSWLKVKDKKNNGINNNLFILSIYPIPTFLQRDG
jgi:hypothetical protein